MSRSVGQWFFHLEYRPSINLDNVWWPTSVVVAVLDSTKQFLVDLHVWGITYIIALKSPPRTMVLCRLRKALKSPDIVNRQPYQELYSGPWESPIPYNYLDFFMMKPFFVWLSMVESIASYLYQRFDQIFSWRVIFSDFFHNTLFWTNTELYFVTLSTRP